MTETTHSNDVGPASDASSPALEPVTKVTRARATTSDVPRRASSDASRRTARPKPAAPEPTERRASARSEASSATAGAGRQSTTELNDRPAVVEIYQGGADSIEGDTVTITQGGASVVNARSVQIRQGGIANAQAQDITVSMGGVALARADRVSVEMGGLGIAFAREAHLTQGGARSIIAQDVRVDQSLVGTALAGRVSFERPSGVFLLIAGRVEGPVKALFDWRGAIVFGAAFGLVVGIIRRR